MKHIVRLLIALFVIINVLIPCIAYASEPYAAYIPLDREAQTSSFRVVLPSGKTEKYSLDIIKNSDDFDTVVLSGESGSMEIFSEYNYLYSAGLIDILGKNTFLLATIDMASDDFQTVCIAFTDNGPVMTDSVYAIAAVSDISNMTLEFSTHVYVLGTWGVSTTGYLTEEGKFCAYSDLWTISAWTSIKTARQMSAEFFNNGTWEQSVLSAGIEITPFATNNDSVLWFRTEGGAIGRLSPQYQDYELAIDGVNEFELFEELPYAD